MPKVMGRATKLRKLRRNPSITNMPVSHRTPVNSEPRISIASLRLRAVISTTALVISSDKKLANGRSLSTADIMSANSTTRPEPRTVSVSEMRVSLKESAQRIK